MPSGGPAFPEFFPRDRINPGSRLVQEEYRRLMDECTTQRQFLFHPAGKFSCFPFSERLDLHIDIFDQMVVFSDSGIEYGQQRNSGFLQHSDPGIRKTDGI